MANLPKPREVTRIYDNGGATQDRYMIVLGGPDSLELNECLGLDETPESPLGFSQMGECRVGAHLGKRLEWNDLPKEIQKHIRGKLSE